MRIIHLLFLLLTAGVSPPTAIEMQKYEIQLFGDKIGEMTITRETKPDGTEFYVVESASKAKILWINRDNYSHYEFTFKAGKLIATSYKEMEGGKISRWGQMKKEGNVYVVSNYAGKKVFTEVPEFSIPSIYFGQVKKMKRIYYDAEAEFVNVEHPDANTIEFKTSDGHRNVYHFENGQLHHMEFHVSIATAKMIRVK